MIGFEQIKRQLGTGDNWKPALSRPTRPSPNKSKENDLLAVMPTTHFVFVRDLLATGILERSTIQRHLKNLCDAGKVERGPDVLIKGNYLSQWRKIE